MREHVINEVRKLKEKESDFKGQEWKDIYFATDTQNLHISEINYEELNDDDLLRFLVFLIMGWGGAIERRIRSIATMSFEDSFRYHSFCAKATLYPNKSNEEVSAIIEEDLSKMKANTRIYDRELDTAEDHIMTVEDWQDAVEAGYFDNDDGCGYWVKDGLACRDEVFNSEPQDATHVVWYNK